MLGASQVSDPSFDIGRLTERVQSLTQETKENAGRLEHTRDLLMSKLDEQTSTISDKFDARLGVLSEKMQSLMEGFVTRNEWIDFRSKTKEDLQGIAASLRTDISEMRGRYEPYVKIVDTMVARGEERKELREPENNIKGQVISGIVIALILAVTQWLSALYLSHPNGH